MNNSHSLHITALFPYSSRRFTIASAPWVLLCSLHSFTVYAFNTICISLTRLLLHHHSQHLSSIESLVTCCQFEWNTSFPSHFSHLSVLLNYVLFSSLRHPSDASLLVRAFPITLSHSCLSNASFIYRFGTNFSKCILHSFNACRV